MSAPVFISPNQAKYELTPANYQALVTVLRTSKEVSNLVVGIDGQEGTLTAQGVDFAWTYDGQAELLLVIVKVHSWLARGAGNESIFGHINTQLIITHKVSLNWTLARQVIDEHEGLRLVVYRDTRGNRTIGKGFNLDAPGAAQKCKDRGLDLQALLNGASITEAQADQIRDDFILSAYLAACSVISNFDRLPDNAQVVVVDMIFEMGPGKFAGFHDLIAALNKPVVEFADAAAAMKKSHWCREVPSRAEDDCQRMLANP